MRFLLRSMAALAVALCTVPPLLHGQVAAAPPAWLRYAIPPDPPRYHDMPHAVVQLGDAPEEKTAADELDRGLGHMVAGTDHLLRRFDPRLDSIVLGTSDALRRVRPRMLVDAAAAPLAEDAYRIRRVRRRERQWWVLEGGSPRAELYAAFRFAALVAEDRQLPDALAETARVPLRAIDLRGDLGSLTAADDLPVLARLMASVCLNSLIVDGAGAVQPQHVVTVMRPFGIRVWFRGLPPDAAAGLPGAGGIALAASADLKHLGTDTVKADAAARLLRRHGQSVLLEDAFEPAWQPGTASPDQRASMLHGLEPNVVLVSDAVPPSLPLAGLAAPGFGLLPGEPQMAAFRLLPGEERAVAFPASVWESALATPERGASEDGALAGLVSHHGGVMASLTVPQLAVMIAQPLFQANLFGFGRVAWNPSEAPDEIADAWARQTFGDDARIFGVAKEILLASAAAFANVSSPFGMPWLGDGARPDPTRAGRRDAAMPLASPQGVGIDRAAQFADYPEAFAAQLSDPEKSPERWLLAAQRVAPSHRMANGKTLVQDFYDAHFAGAAQMANALDAWEGTKGLVDAERYAAVHDLLSAAARQGEVWRDSTTEWMERATGIADEPHFVGSHPGRIEGEAMNLAGYAAVHAGEPEDASGSAFVACSVAACSGETVFNGEANVYRVEVGYYDTAVAGRTLELSVNGTTQARWPVEQAAGEPTSALAERFVVNGVRLKPGDRVKISGQATVDFVDITRDPRWN